MKKVKLKPCPFCGEIPEILICDNEGDVHDKAYLKNPWIGLSFALTHTNSKCPIRVEYQEVLGGAFYNTLKELQECWNKRIE